MYREEKNVKIDISEIVGINKHVKKTFDKLIHKTKVEFCKQTKWKLSECVVCAKPEIQITLKRKLREEEQTVDWTELIK